jgi:pimeloyl-ACP methyl ester carboxylesterase
LLFDPASRCQREYIMGKTDLLLLHGALGSKSQFSPLIPLFGDTFHVHTLDFEGHGESGPKDRPFRNNYFEENVLEYLDDHSIEKVHVFGYSMGGQIALNLAAAHPERIDRVFTLAVKFKWTPEIAAKEAAFLDADYISQKFPRYAETLEQRHVAAGWKNVLRKTKEMFLGLDTRNRSPAEEVRKISHLVRIGLGDRDNMVSLEETVEVYESLQRGELQVFPNTSHPLEKVPLSHLTYSLGDFFK